MQVATNQQNPLLAQTTLAGKLSPTLAETVKSALSSRANAASGAASVDGLDPANIAKAQRIAKTARLAQLSGVDATQGPGALSPSNNGPRGRLAGILGVPPNQSIPGDAPQIASLSDSIIDRELSIDGLMERWGTDDQQYDLDKSGSVDMADLIELLARSRPGTMAPPSMPDQKTADPALGTTADALAAQPAASVSTTAPKASPASTPMAPLDPTEPATPADPADPTAPSMRTDPVDTGAAVDPKKSAEATKPAVTTGPVDPATEVDPADPATTTGPIRSTAAVDPAGATPDTPPTAPTMDGLLEAWGTSDPMYDFDGDGTVGMPDLVSMLAREAEAAMAGVKTPAKTANPDTTSGPVTGDAAISTDPTISADPTSPIGSTSAIDPAVTDPAAADDAKTGEPTLPDPIADPGTLTLEGFAKAWGTDASQFDLDGDGTVGMNDLVSFLANQDDPRMQVAATIASSVMDRLSNASDRIDAAREAIDDPELSALLDTVERVTDALAEKLEDPLGTTTVGRGEDGDPSAEDWGITTGVDPELADSAPPRRTAIPPAWLFGAGSTLGIAAQADDAASIETIAGLTDSAIRASDVTSQQQAAGIIANALQERLSSFGFDQQPPDNLHQIVDRLGLSSDDSSMVMKQLQDRWPGGLGLDVLG